MLGLHGCTGGAIWLIHSALKGAERDGHPSCHSHDRADPQLSKIAGHCRTARSMLADRAGEDLLSLDRRMKDATDPNCQLTCDPTSCESRSSLEIRSVRVAVGAVEVLELPWCGASSDQPVDVMTSRSAPVASIDGCRCVHCKLATISHKREVRE